MRKDRLAKLLLVLVVPMTGGCQSLFHVKSAKTAMQPVEVVDSEHDSAVQALSAGRTALEEGRYAAALDAFRFARHAPDQSAAAYNGMAVTYSRLGRQDLTERYFLEAISRAPDDLRYQKNLARYYQINAVKAFAKDEQEHRPVRSQRPLVAQATSEPATSAPAPQAQGLNPRAAVRVEQPASRIVQASSSEVIISSVHSSAIAIATGIPHKNPAIRFSSPGQLANSQIVKVSLHSGQAGSSPKAGDAQVQYPVRVSLGSSAE